VLPQRNLADPRNDENMVSRGCRLSALSAGSTRSATGHGGQVVVGVEDAPGAPDVVQRLCKGCTRGGEGRKLGEHAAAIAVPILGLVVPHAVLSVFVLKERR